MTETTVFNESMAEIAGPKTFKEIMSRPEHDYCLGRFLSLANELLAAGYKHKHIADAAVSLGLHHSMKESMSYHLHHLHGLEKIGRDSIKDIDRLVEECKKAGTLLKN